MPDDGYARNYLFPESWPLRLPIKTRELRSRQAAESKRKQAELEEARKQAEALSSLEVVVKAKSGESGKLFVHYQ